MPRVQIPTSKSISIQMFIPKSSTQLPKEDFCSIEFEGNDENGNPEQWYSESVFIYDICFFDTEKLSLTGERMVVVELKIAFLEKQDYSVSITG